MPKFLALTLLALILTAAGAHSTSLLSEAELRQLTEMLQTADLDSSSLCFEKDWDLSTKYKSKWQLAQLQNPWQALDDLQELRQLCATGADDPEGWSGLLLRLGEVAFNNDPFRSKDIYSSARRDYELRFSRQVKQPKQLFAFMEKELQELDGVLGQSFEALSTADRRRLNSWFYGTFCESDDAERYNSFLKEAGLPAYDSLDQSQIQEHLGAVYFPSLALAGVRYLALCDAVVANAGKLKYSNKILYKRTRFGLMVIGSTGNDHYSYKTLPRLPLCLLIEPGGNDIYELEIATGSKNPFYLVVDFQGDDVYRGSAPGALFYSSCGLGYSYDLQGDDLYQTDDFAFCSFNGINLHQDLAGNDTYQSGLFSQGAAANGISLLLDHAGNDSYQASSQAQGFGSTQGAGALLDLDGADIYYLGGTYFHAPLMPLDYRTLGQGMGFGLRPELAGGLGLLYDKSGNDKYLGGVYAQGVGYWYASGVLIDEAGNDVYNAVYYPQGSGIHLACGMLYDGAGDDAYYSRNGPGQGAGHDWALGILIDAAGNDAYSIHGGNGLGLTNSVALFVDRSGDDRYERSEAQNYGNANFSRSTGGIGLFLDAGGKDVYPDSLMQNDKTWQKGTYGIGRDVALNEIAKTAVEELAESATLPDSTASIEDIFAAASEWEVGSAVQRVRAARAILLSREEEAVVYILANKMNTKSGLEYRALEALAKQSSGFVQKLFYFIDADDSLAAKNALALISGVGDSLLVDYVERLLQDGKYVTASLSCLSGINSARSVQLLKGFIHHPSERYRYIAARSLLQIKHPSARQTLLQMEDDPSFLVQALLRNLPPEPEP